MVHHPQQPTFKKERDTINNSRNTGMNWKYLGQRDVRLPTSVTVV